MSSKQPKDTKGTKGAQADKPGKGDKKNGMELTEKDLEKVSGGASWNGGVGDPLKIQ